MENKCVNHSPYARPVPVPMPHPAHTLGMAYVPWQTFSNIYEPCMALKKGTIFIELDKPFEGGNFR